MDKKISESISISNPHPDINNGTQKAGLFLLGMGLLSILVAAFRGGSEYPLLFFALSIGLTITGSLIYIINFYKGKPTGVNNNRVWQAALTSRGIWGWLLGMVITGFYVLLYWFPQSLEHLTRMMDPLSLFLSGQRADQWFLYGTVYTLAVVVMGYKAILKYRHSRYHVIRTTSIIFFQLGFAFLLPSLLKLFNQPEFYFSYFWPLKQEYLFPGTVHQLMGNSGALGTFMIFWGAMMTFIATPILTYFYGKRWYCSWVCGCGGLANTAGDPFRQLSDKSVKAWKMERWMIYTVLGFITVTTAMLWINSYSKGAILGETSMLFSQWYGFFIGSVFSGVIGVGFYPVMGTRVWCRFGCPMAAILGIQQRFFSRFRISTNGGQCISCGNCSTYCEMGIDVKWYAQRGQNIVRSSCVGCGICSTVCPRGVLNLENGPLKGRINDDPILIGKDEVTLNKANL